MVRKKVIRKTKLPTEDQKMEIFMQAVDLRQGVQMAFES